MLPLLFIVINSSIYRYYSVMTMVKNLLNLKKNEYINLQFKSHNIMLGSFIE